MIIMVGLLALIGFLVVLWFLSKAFTFCGNLLIHAGEAMAESKIRSERKEKTLSDIHKELTGIHEQLQVTKGVPNDDAEFNRRISKEIDELTSEDQ